MLNLIEELDNAIEGSRHIPQDILWMELDFGTYNIPSIELPATNGIEGYNKVVDLYQGIEYDDSYGTQHLEGTVVFRDGSWLQRGEYDGSEWWEHKFTPIKPKDNL